MTMQLHSSAFAPDARIPIRHTCDGNNLSPPLSWSGAPEKARSFALICSDPDAPGNTWYHWGVYDIPASVTSLAEYVQDGPDTPPQARNDFGHDGYGGPCPPEGHGVHRYCLTLYALPVPHLGLTQPVRCRDLERVAAARALTTAQLMFTYSRPA